MRLVPILALSLAALTLPVVITHPAEATDRRINVDTSPPAARTPSDRRGGEPGSDRFDGRGRDHRRRHGHQHPVIIVPQIVFVAPNRCWQPGYWTYQYVQQSYSHGTNTWVPGQWTPDGRWIDGYYATAVYNTGSYQPLWVEGHYC